MNWHSLSTLFSSGGFQFSEHLYPPTPQHRLFCLQNKAAFLNLHIYPSHVKFVAIGNSCHNSGSQNFQNRCKLKEAINNDTVRAFGDDLWSWM